MTVPSSAEARRNQLVEREPAVTERAALMNGEFFRPARIYSPYRRVSSRGACTGLVTVPAGVPPPPAHDLRKDELSVVVRQSERAAGTYRRRLASHPIDRSLRSSGGVRRSIMWIVSCYSEASGQRRTHPEPLERAVAWKKRRETDSQRERRPLICGGSASARDEQRREGLTAKPRKRILPDPGLRPLVHVGVAGGVRT
jgi:hypothetical protein